VLLLVSAASAGRHCMGDLRPGAARLMAMEHEQQPTSTVHTVIDASPNTALASLNEINAALEGMDGPNEELARSLVSSAARALSVLGADAESVIDVRNKLSLGEHLLRLRGARLIEANLVVAQRLRTERRLGEILPSLISEGRPKQSGDTTVYRLGELSLSRDQSMKFQRIAQIDEADFESMISEQINDKELSTEWAMRLWTAFVKSTIEAGEDPRAATRPPEPEHAPEQESTCQCHCREQLTCPDCGHLWGL
jgi:hypothetical protein